MNLLLCRRGNPRALSHSSCDRPYRTRIWCPLWESNDKKPRGEQLTDVDMAEQREPRGEGRGGRGGQSVPHHCLHTSRTAQGRPGATSADTVSQLKLPTTALAFLTFRTHIHIQASNDPFAASAFARKPQSVRSPNRYCPYFTNSLKFSQIL